MSGKTLVPAKRIFMGVRVTEREYRFLSALRAGERPSQAAAIAGYANPASVGSSLMARPHIKTALERIQEETREQIHVSRESIVAKLEEAYQIARAGEDASAMVRVCAELNRMFGYYAPEKKQLIAPKPQTEEDLQQLPDEKLVELLEGEDGIWSIATT